MTKRPSRCLIETSIRPPSGVYRTALSMRTRKQGANLIRGASANGLTSEIQLQIDLLAVGQRSVVCDHLEDERIDVDSLVPDGAAIFEPRQIKQLIDERARAPNAARKSPDRSGMGVPRLAGEIFHLDLHPRERRPELVSGVGNKSSLRLDGVMQADDEAVHAARERGDFCGNPVERDRRPRADAALGKFNGKRVQSRQHPIHRPSDHEPRQRDGDQDRRGRPERRGLCDFLTHHFLLRNLNRVPGIARRVDAPFFARGFGVCVARPGLRRDVDGRKRCVDEPALRIPDADRESIFGVLIRLRGRVCGETPTPALTAIWRS